MYIFALTNIAARDLKNEVIYPPIEEVVLQNRIDIPPIEIVAINPVSKSASTVSSIEPLFHNGEISNTSCSAPIVISNEASSNEINYEVSIQSVDKIENSKPLSIVSI